MAYREPDAYEGSYAIWFDNGQDNTALDPQLATSFVRRVPTLSMDLIRYAQMTPVTIQRADYTPDPLPVPPPRQVTNYHEAHDALKWALEELRLSHVIQTQITLPVEPDPSGPGPETLEQLVMRRWWRTHLLLTRWMNKIRDCDTTTAQRAELARAWESDQTALRTMPAYLLVSEFLASVGADPSMEENVDFTIMLPEP